MIIFMLNLLIGVLVFCSCLFLRNSKEDLPGPSQQEAELPDYNFYQMTGKEVIVYQFLGVLAVFFWGYVFYHSYIISLFLSPVGLLYRRLKMKELITRQKHDLNNQFKEALYSLTSSLNAGRSFEMAIRGVMEDLSLLYPSPKTHILKEFRAIIRKTEMNVPLEESWRDFARRAHLEDIENFVDVFVIAQRGGGDLLTVLRTTTEIIGEKIAIKQEMDTLLAERKFEQRILNIMPPLLVLFLTWSTGSYMEPVFSSLEGKLIMTVSLILLLAAYFLSLRIMSIEV